MTADGMLVGGRVAVVLSALGFWALWTRTSINHDANIAIFSGLILLSCVEKAASIANLVSVERDWVYLTRSLLSLLLISCVQVVVIADENEHVLQSKSAMDDIRYAMASSYACHHAC